MSTVDAYTALEAHRKQYIYYRTDHHWTALGAYYAYTAYVGEENAAPLEDMEEYRLPGFLGTMYKFTSMIPQNSALAENPDEIIYYRQPDAEAYAYSGGEMDDPKPMSVILSPEESDPEFKYSVFLGGDHALVKITTSAAGGKSVLVVKDSYANALIPYLVNNYAVIYIADPRYLGSDDKPFSITKFIADNNVGELLFVNYAVALMNNDWTLLLQRIK